MTNCCRCLGGAETLSEAQIDPATVNDAARTEGERPIAPKTSEQRRLERLAWVLDDAIPLPGGYRVGVDGFIGLIPGVGDAAGLAASTYVLWQAVRLGIPGVVIARMVANIALEMLVGVVPLLGDLFDFVFKANRRNVALMERSISTACGRVATRRGSWGVLLAMLLVLGLVFAASVWAAFALLRWVVGLF